MKFDWTMILSVFVGVALGNAATAYIVSPAIDAILPKQGA